MKTKGTFTTREIYQQRDASFLKYIHKKKNKNTATSSKWNAFNHLIKDNLKTILMAHGTVHNTAQT